jgi:hypothetical protein
MKEMEVRLTRAEIIDALRTASINKVRQVLFGFDGSCYQFANAEGVKLPVGSSEEVRITLRRNDPQPVDNEINSDKEV